jgi:hypothetical protein
MWKCKIIKSTLRVVDFLNENNIKPENCKILTDCDDYYSVFYYVEK